MKRSALLLLCLALACTTLAEDDEAVITATGETFDELIKNNSFVAVEFYAPWCGHCKKLAPEWEAAAQKLKAGEGDPIVLAKVDCTEEKSKALATKYGIQGFPTIKVFRDHDLEKPGAYEGPREQAGIVSYLKKQAGPATALLKDAAAAEAFVKLDDDKDVVVIGVFPGGESGDEFKAFSDVASTLRSDYEFRHITDASHLDAAKGLKEAGILLYKEDEETPVSTYGGAFSKADIAAWVEKTSAPAIVTLDQNPKNRKALQKIFADTKAKLLGFIAKDNKGHKEFKDALIAAGKASDDVSVIFAETEGNDGALDYFGLKAKDTPAFVIHDSAGGDAKYVVKDVKATDLTEWLAKFKDGKLEKTVKSEEAPEKNDGPVTILTANTFDDLVFKKPRNVFIEFYAPWCGHCKTLAPIWEEVGKEFQDDDTVVIAKMDATANDIPDTKKFPVKGFPTLKFVTADGKVVDYNGDRSKDDIIKFIKSNADSAAPAKDEL